MSDTREVLVARQREEYGESWDVLVPEVGWTLGRIIESVIEDVLALLPGRYETEVRREAAEKAWDEGWDARHHYDERGGEPAPSNPHTKETT